MMNMDSVEIVQFDNKKHREQVIALWRDVFGYSKAHNRPELALDKKLAVKDGLLLVALDQEIVAGTVMAGYDGHRGWIYSMAVLPDYQQKGIGSALLAHAEKKLSGLGCMKINLQIFEDNEEVQRFYQANGYLTEKRISMGKLMKENIENICPD